MDTAGIDWSRFDAEEVVRGLNKEEREKRLGKISMIMELQGKINELKITLKTREKKKGKEDDRRCKESHERNEKKREEKEERRRIDNK